MYSIPLNSAALYITSIGTVEEEEELARVCNLRHAKCSHSSLFHLMLLDYLFYVAKGELSNYVRAAYDFCAFLFKCLSCSVINLHPSPLALSILLHFSYFNPLIFAICCFATQYMLHGRLSPSLADMYLVSTASPSPSATSSSL